MNRSLWLAPIAVQIGIALVTPKALQAATVDEGYRHAEQSLTDALSKGDAKAAAALLDDRFQWVESNGKVNTKAQVLEKLSQFASDDEGASDVRTEDLLGRVERVLGVHHNLRFAHLWVKTTAGWQAFAFLDIPIPAEKRQQTPRPPKDPTADCDNPCRSVPYKPENEAQAGALATWLRLKTDEWHPNPEDWAAHADELHETISPNDDEPKLKHVDRLKEQLALYGEHGADPGENVITMKMYDFGNVVIQENLQGPQGAPKPTTWVMRVFVNRGDGWKIALSAQTKIQGN